MANPLLKFYRGINEPQVAEVGMLWFAPVEGDNAEGILKVYNGTAWEVYGVTPTQLALLETACNSAVAVEKERAEGVEAGLQNAIDVLNGKGDGSVSKAVSDAIAELVDEAPEELNTLKEIVDFIKEHGTEYAALVETVNKKANSADVYTKTEIDGFRAADKRACEDALAAYKTEVSTALSGKADTSALNAVSEKVTKLEDMSHDFASADAKLKSELTTDIATAKSEAQKYAATVAGTAKTEANAYTDAEIAKLDKAYKDADTALRSGIDANAGDITALENTVGDSTKGLVKAVADLRSELNALGDIEGGEGIGGMIDAKIAALDVEDAAVAGQYVSSVSEVDGKIEVTRVALPDYTSDFAAKANASDLTAHTGNTEIHITADERTAWNAAEQNAKDYADGKFQEKGNYETAGAAATVQGNLNSHVADTVKHITADERTAWNSAKTAIDAFLKDADMTEKAVDTLAELQTYMTTDGAAAAKLVERVAALEAIDHDAYKAADTVLETSLKSYADQAEADALAAAKADAAALYQAKGSYEAAGAAAQALTDAKAYVDGKVDGKFDAAGAAADAQAAAIAAAAADATSKADAAKAAAIADAAEKYQLKGNYATIAQVDTAKQEAIEAAGIEAATKAQDAETNAKAYTNEQIEELEGKIAGTVTKVTAETAIADGNSSFVSVSASAATGEVALTSAVKVVGDVPAAQLPVNYTSEAATGLATDKYVHDYVASQLAWVSF